MAQSILSVDRQARGYNPFSSKSLFGVSLALALLSAQLRSEDNPTLNEIQARHIGVHEHVSPAVVAVQTRGGKGGNGFYGTGVVVSPTGLILTSSTVVPSETKTVQIFFPDGRVMDAKVLGTDLGTEACALQVCVEPNEKKPLPYIELADSSKCSVGELAYTAGNPFHTISRDGQVAWSVGTVSGIYKISSDDEQSHYKGTVLETDAAVNPGSDGGPLMDSNGRLLGILSLCFCQSRWLGTAIPVHLIKQGLATHLRDVPLLDPKTPMASNPTVKTTTPAVARAVPDAMRAACRHAAKAMVKVLVKRENGGGEGVGRRALTVKNRQQQRPDAPATGVIIEADGYIITSAFNIEGDIEKIDVQLSDGTVLPATLLGRHMGLDVALLKVTHPKGEVLPAIALAGDPELKIGRYVAVLGSSEDGPVTHTMGIVSALGRLDGTGVQTDALINYGNSGGPVVDLRARLVGIAAQVNTRSDWSQQNSGVGFFTQSDKVLACLADLKASRDMKAPAKPFLGISPVDNATEIRGVKLEQVIPGSAAAEAKLQPGDIILAVDGMDTHSWPALVRVLKAHKPGDSIEIAYQRGSVTSRTRTVLGSPKNVR